MGFIAREFIGLFEFLPKRTLIVFHWRQFQYLNIILNQTRQKNVLLLLWLIYSTFDDCLLIHFKLFADLPSENFLILNKLMLNTIQMWLVWFVKIKLPVLMHFNRLSNDLHSLMQKVHKLKLYIFVLLPRQLNIF